jgi:hypothetical protein
MKKNACFGTRLTRLLRDTTRCEDEGIVLLMDSISIPRALISTGHPGMPHEIWETPLESCWRHPPEVNAQCDRRAIKRRHRSFARHSPKLHLETTSSYAQHPVSPAASPLTPCVWSTPVCIRVSVKHVWAKARILTNVPVPNTSKSSSANKAEGALPLLPNKHPSLRDENVKIRVRENKHKHVAFSLNKQTRRLEIKGLSLKNRVVLFRLCGTSHTHQLKATMLLRGSVGYEADQNVQS